MLSWELEVGRWHLKFEATILNAGSVWEAGSSHREVGRPDQEVEN